MSARPLRVGLTGGVASGKSTVARLFAALGVAIIDTDIIAREVLAPGSLALQAVIAQFGTQFLQPDGALNRRALRAHVFADIAARQQLEALTHPLILASMEAQANAAVSRYVLLVIPLLVEKNLQHYVERILLVDCEPAVQLRRLQARDGLPLAQAQAMLAAQTDRAARLRAAHDVIDNNATLAELSAAVSRLHLRYLTAK
jgi:dephospho-CoA kinase